MRGKDVVVAGWGKTSCPNPNPTNPNDACSQGSAANILQEITLAVPSAAVCTSADGLDTAANNLFCMGGEAGKDSCFGDSGSGVVYNNNNK